MNKNSCGIKINYKQFFDGLLIIVVVVVLSTIICVALYGALLGK